MPVFSFAAGTRTTLPPCRLALGWVTSGGSVASPNFRDKTIFNLSRIPRRPPLDVSGQGRPFGSRAWGETQGFSRMFGKSVSRETSGTTLVMTLPLRSTMRKGITSQSKQTPG